EIGLPAAQEVEVDLGQKLAVEQGAVSRAGGGVDGEALAEGIEAVGQARKATLGQEERVDGAVEGPRIAGQPPELGIDEPQVEGSVVDDDRAVADELEKGLDDVGEDGI